MNFSTYRKTTSRKRFSPDRLQHVWGGARSEPDWKQPSATVIAGVAVVAVVIAAGVYFGPDLIRYMKIRRM